MSKQETTQGRKQDVHEAIRLLIQELHNLDHKTDHKSTIELFKSKLLQNTLKLLDCKHYKDAKMFDKTKEEGIFQCYGCEKTYSKNYIKEHYSLEVN